MFRIRVSCAELMAIFFAGLRETKASPAESFQLECACVCSGGGGRYVSADRIYSSTVIRLHCWSRLMWPVEHLRFTQ